MIKTRLIQPAYLKKGDAAGIVAPAGIVQTQDIEPALEILKGWGLEIRKGKFLYEKHHFFAGTDEQRLEDIQEMMDDPEIKVIFFARGGYGTIRLIERIDFRKFLKHPKWLVGYSDITIFHIYLPQVLKCESIHGIMPKNFVKGNEDQQSLNHLQKILFGENLHYKMNPYLLNRNGRVRGKLTGGNLSILYSLQGTPYEIETKGKILFIEDVNEYLYHLERMLISFRMSGKLDKLKGLIVGGMTDMKNTTPEFGKEANEIVAGLVKDYDYPVLFNFPAGHMFPNLPLVMGRETLMEVSEEGGEVWLK